MNAKKLTNHKSYCTCTLWLTVDDSIKKEEQQSVIQKQFSNLCTNRKGYLGAGCLFDGYTTLLFYMIDILIFANLLITTSLLKLN